MSCRWWEVDCHEDRITRLVARPDEAREDRDDTGHFLFSDEQFNRQRVDGQLEAHPLWVANPPRGRLLPGPPLDWPPLRTWQTMFAIEEVDRGACEDDRYENVHSYRSAKEQDDLW